MTARVGLRAERLTRAGVYVCWGERARQAEGVPRYYRQAGPVELKIERALVLILPVEFHCRCVVRICSQVLLDI